MLLFNPFNRLTLRPIVGYKIHFSRWVELQKDQSIVVLEPFDLRYNGDEPELTIVNSSYRTSVMHHENVNYANELEEFGSWERHYNDLEKILKQMEIHDKIEGFKCLVTGTSDFVWVSCYDFEILKSMQQ